VSERAKSVVGLAVVVVAALLARLPPYLNAGAVNSDAAIVGLQAIALLERGEHDLHLWGANYQTTVDVWVVAGLFKVFGPSPWVLFLVPYLGAAAVAALVFLMLRRGMPASAAALATLTVSFGSQAITSPMTTVLRQVMFVTVVLGLWLVHRASSTRRAPLQLFCGAASFGLAIFVDVFATILWPACALLAIACCFDKRFEWKRLAAVAAGLAAGLFAALLAGHLGSGMTPGLKWAYLRRSWPLFSDQCLPYALSTRVWIPGTNLYPDLWQPPAVWRWFSLLAAGLLALVWVTPLALAFVRRIEWPMRRLGLFGIAAGTAGVIGFLFSHAPADIWSVRYLAPLMLTVPFALAPLASLVRPRLSGLLLAPYLLSALVGGWLSWGGYVSGPLPVLTMRGSAAQEHEVIDALIARGVTEAISQYWTAYRFTFLSAEKLVTVPIDAIDRYLPYRTRFNNAKRVAMIFDPSEPRLRPEYYEAMLTGRRVQFETLHIAGFTVLVLDRSALR
jgi:hypothetical protein